MTIRGFEKRSFVFDVAAIFCFAFGIRLLELDRAFTGNELFHLLAGRSWSEDGTFSVAYGEYNRNGNFSIFLNLLTQIFGERAVVARMPAVLAGSLSAVALYVWMRFAAGRGAGWVAAILLSVCALAIDISQWARVYALFSFTFFLGAVGVYTAVVADLSRRNTLLVALASTALIAFSFSLHRLIIVGVGGLVLWLLIEHRALLWRWCRALLRSRWAMIVALLVVIAAAAIAWTSDDVRRLILAFRDLQPQGADKQFDYLFYHRWFRSEYPLLWGLTPIAVVFAISRKPSFGLFCACIFFTVFVVYAFASRKWMRYMYFVLPFLFALWGFLVAQAFTWLQRISAEMLDRLEIDDRFPLLRRVATIAVFVVVAVFFIGSNAIVSPVYQHLYSQSGYRADWKGARSVFASWLDDPDAIILASPMQHPLYYYDRADLEFGPKYVYESGTGGAEFGVDRRTGLRAVSSRESMELVFGCHGRGLLVMTKRRWRQSGYGPDDEVFALLQQRATELEGARQHGLVAYAWDDPPVVRSERCSALLPDDSGSTR